MTNLNYEEQQKLEESWEESQKYRTLSDWVGVFPEAKPFLREKLKSLTNRREELNKRAKRFVKKVNDWNPSQRWFYDLWLDVFIMEDVRLLSKEISRLRWVLIPEKWKKGRKITPDDVQRARNFPMSELVKANKQGYAKCPFHEDNDPSFYIKKYKKREYGHCFGCSWGGDPIAFVMDRYEVSFIKAVKLLAR